MEDMTPAQKRRATMIRVHFNGDEQAYLAAQRKQGGKGGKKGGRSFRDTPGAAQAAANKRWGNGNGKNTKSKS